MRRLLTLAVVCCACADFDDLERNKPHDVVVSVVDTFHSDAGLTSVPLSSAAGDVAAYVDNADHGWSVIRGTWVDAGVALLEGVPPGFTLVARPDHAVMAAIATDDLTVDLGIELPGPPGSAAASGTTANFTVTGGDATDGGTLVVARVPRYGLTVDNVTSFSPPAFDALRPADGGFVFSYSWAQLPLLSSEPVELVELPLQVLDGGAFLWSASKRGLSLATLANGVGSTVNVALEDAPAGAVPGASFDVSTLQRALLDNLPGAAAKGVYLRTLLSAGDAYSALTAQSLFVPDGGGTLSAPPLSVNPLPDEAWTPLLQASVYVEASITVGAATQKALLAATTTGPIGDDSWAARTVGPVTGLTVDPSTGALSPTLTWLGTAPSYAVVTLALSPTTGNGVVSVPVDYAVVWGTALHVRPDVLQPGASYVFLVEAIDCGQQGRTAPLKSTPTNRCSTAYNLSLVYSPRSD